MAPVFQSTCLFISVYIHVLTIPAQGQIEDCVTECFTPYDQGTEQITCSVVDAALSCFNNNLIDCDLDFTANLYYDQALQDYTTLECSSASESTTEVANPVPCPSVPDLYSSNPSAPISRASISQTSSPPDCTTMHPSRMEQCSLFMDSQLRAFSTYRNGLEACSLPGVWYLLKHQDLTIKVEGTNLESGSNHTRLTKVNVTFHSHDCNPTPSFYVAYHSELLPSNFSYAGTSSTLELVSYTNGSVVTLFAAWLRTTIIIRQYMEFLSVTLQVPTEISSESEGLCTGCPAHQYINITDFNRLIPTICPDDNSRAIDNCFNYGGVTNINGLTEIINNTYLDACIYSIYKTKTPEVLSMFNAIASDALQLLPGIGTVSTSHTPIQRTISTHPSSTDINPTTRDSSNSISLQCSMFIVIVNSLCALGIILR